MNAPVPRLEGWRGLLAHRQLRILLSIVLTLGTCLGPAWAGAAPSLDAGSPTPGCDPGGVCAFDPETPATAAPVPTKEERAKVSLLFFWGVGCPHCEEAKPFLARLQNERPELVVEAIEVRENAAGRQRFLETMRRLGTTASGIPTFVVGSRHLVGFTRGVSEEQLIQLVDGGGSNAPAVAADEVRTKWFGRLSASELGLPLFTLALGLLDGFNPCAMWVLVFLLSMLAGLRDRTRMAMTATTFVVVSGVVYFLFMAAWLSAFLVVGMTRPVQLVLGCVALGMGLVNLKDFFAFGRGLSLSIPDSAKPGIYARVRRILQEHSLAGSMLGVAALAVMVNFIELLCTAGLPAIFTSVLARHELSTWARLGYLGLYNVAYIADDAVMVTLAVVTLSRRRMSETAGRWLKLISGAIMVALGVLLLARPEWLP